MQGVLIYKKAHQCGFQPPGRAFAGLACLNDHKYVLYGGSAGQIFNDVRCFEADNYEWSYVRKNVDTKDLYSRYAHCVGAFSNFLVMFGG
jgi:hypothetical protein